jgi:hypothetical protein
VRERLHRLELGAVVVDDPVDVVLADGDPVLALGGALEREVERVRRAVPPVDGPVVAGVLVHEPRAHVEVVDEHALADVGQQRPPGLGNLRVGGDRVEGPVDLVGLLDRLVELQELGVARDLPTDRVAVRHHAQEPGVELEVEALLVG